jgi:hypothetical protein
MTTTAKATAAETILAIDLGKYKSVACLYRSADDQRFVSFTTSRAEIARMLDKHQHKARPQVSKRAWRPAVNMRRGPETRAERQGVLS